MYSLLVLDPFRNMKVICNNVNGDDFFVKYKTFNTFYLSQSCDDICFCLQVTCIFVLYVNKINKYFFAVVNYFVFNPIILYVFVLGISICSTCKTSNNQCMVKLILIFLTKHSIPLYQPFYTVYIF